ncbi:MAG TPA: membrane protein insertase YidC, partial [Kiritimatiellae bacterium]|nr:membrane protein insertase YidC [Kiritimatiellia bacterium]
RGLAAYGRAGERVAGGLYPPQGDLGRQVVLENSLLRLSLCSFGAGIASAVLKEYPSTADKNSPSVRLDFAEIPAAAWYFHTDAGCESPYFELRDHTPTSVCWRAAYRGFELERCVWLGTGYLVNVKDRIRAGAEGGYLAEQWLTLGMMEQHEGKTRYAYLGMDILRSGGEGVLHLASRISRMFAAEKRKRGLGLMPSAIVVPVLTNQLSADWVAVKNKYFVQVARTEGGLDGAWLIARRALEKGERPDSPTARRMTGVSHVGGAAVLPAVRLAARETVERWTFFYLGPKEYARLGALGYRAVEIMEFGMWTPISRVLLWTLNWIHDHVWPHNYGLAIMLLTVLIRIVFWPVTHASTVSMKRLQEIQPLINEVRQKYKDNPQKQQKEMMAIYREHKVNPLGGCLPMLIQIPVFIALLVVLRSAIELRFASFLWIRDLSEPEQLLAGVLPIPLNILPILMAVTMHWQQKLTPSGADTQQQKMMLFFPVLMLVFLYNFPSGLVLYWTTNQCLMIAQQLVMRRQLRSA